MRIKFQPLVGKEGLNAQFRKQKLSLLLFLFFPVHLMIQEYCGQITSLSPLLLSRLVVFYAKLFSFISRYNGSLPNGDRGRRKSRFALYKRSRASGVKPSSVHVISTPQTSKVCDTGKSWFLMILSGEPLRYCC